MLGRSAHPRPRGCRPAIGTRAGLDASACSMTAARWERMFRHAGGHRLECVDRGQGRRPAKDRAQPGRAAQSGGQGRRATEGSRARGNKTAPANAGPPKNFDPVTTTGQPRLRYAADCLRFYTRLTGIDDDIRTVRWRHRRNQSRLCAMCQINDGAARRRGRRGCEGIIHLVVGPRRTVGRPKLDFNRCSWAVGQRHAAVCSVEQTTHGRHGHAGAGFRRRRENGRHGLARPLRGEEHRRRQQGIRAGRTQERPRQRTNTEVPKQSCFNLVVRAASRSARCRGDGARVMSEKASAALSNP